MCENWRNSNNFEGFLSHSHIIFLLIEAVIEAFLSEDNVSSVENDMNFLSFSFPFQPYDTSNEFNINGDKET